METKKEYTFWTEEDIKKLKELSGTMNFKDMARLHFPGKTPTSLQKKALKLGLESVYRYKKHSYDEHFYDVPNLLNTYYAANFAADGYLKHIASYYIYTLCINTKDVSIIENFKRDCKFTGPFRSYQRKNYEKETLKNVSYMNMTATVWAEPLKNNFGIVPNKTLRMSPPNLKDNDLIDAYLVGYLDGDGSIGIQKDTKGASTRITLRYYSCNLQILEWILKRLKEICQYYNYILNAQVSKNENVYTIGAYGKTAAIIFNHLEKINVPKLKRKWENPLILERMNEYKKKYPHIFNDKNTIQIPTIPLI